MAVQTRSAMAEVAQAVIVAARPAGPGWLNRTGSGSRMPANTAAPAAASRPRASQILASPP
jgi:hypothetical protein